MNGLRILRGLTLRAVDEKTGEISPFDNPKAKPEIKNGKKIYTESHVSFSYLVNIEKGKISRPSPAKLHALAIVYDEPYEFISFKAGLRPVNPFTEQNLTHEAIRDSYFKNLTTSKKRRPLTKEEKLAAEKMLETFVMAITGGIGKKPSFGEEKPV